MRRPAPLATAILGGIAAFVAGGLVWAHAREADPFEQRCSLCGPPAIAVAPGAVWVAQGNLLHRYDPRTGARSPAVEAWPADGSHEVEAALWDRGRLLIAWSGGTGILRDGRVVRHTIRPAMRRVVLIHGQDAAYVLGSRRLIRLDPDGAPGGTRRFRTRGLAEAAARAVAAGTVPSPRAWSADFTVDAGEYRARRRDDLTLWLSHTAGAVRWSTKIPVS